PPRDAGPDADDGTDRVDVDLVRARTFDLLIRAHHAGAQRDERIHALVRAEIIVELRGEGIGHHVAGGDTVVPIEIAIAQADAHPERDAIVPEIADAESETRGRPQPRAERSAILDRQPAEQRQRMRAAVTL